MDGATPPTRADRRADLPAGDEPTPAMYRAIAETAVNPFAIIDDEGVFRWVGESIGELLGWTPGELVGRSMEVIVAPRSRPDVGKAFLDLVNLPPWSDYPCGGVGQLVDLVCRDGSVTPCNVIAATRQQTGLPFHLVFARRAGFELALDNVLEAIAGRADIHDVLGHLVVSLHQSIPGCVVAIGEGWQDGRFARTAGEGDGLLAEGPRSPWARAMATGDDVVVSSLADMPGPAAEAARARGLVSCWVHPVAVAGDDAPSAALVLWRSSDAAPSRFTWTAVHRAGRLLQLSLQWDRSHRALAFAATHDPLTGLANRMAFVTRLEEVAKQSGGEAAMLFIDLDMFKPVNDRYGHLAGDRLLQEVADRLTRILRPGDLVARFGGDEFAVLCERVSDMTDVHVVAGRLLEALSTPFVLDSGTVVTVTCSVGITTLGEGEAPEAILDRADQAMRTAKARGRARWECPPASSPSA